MNEYLKSKDLKKCYGCRACENVCPKNAIVMKENKEGFLYPEIDKDKCVSCGLCSKVCPYSDKLNNSKKEKKIYAAQYSDIEALENSSSGGMFSAFADYVLENNGYVAGCIFDKNYSVLHVVSNEKNIIEKMRGSKYVQSDLGNVYSEIKKILNKGMLVLFTGTPCQVDGLKKFLLKEYDNLITIDFVCHGVPSQKIFDLYLNHIEEKRGKIQSFSFRNKKLNGWCTTGDITCNKNGKVKIFKNSPNNDSYYQYYLNNNINRECCYSCKYSSMNRVSDITIGDSWNINESKINFDLNLGVSLLMINNENGKKHFNKIKNKLKYTEISIDSITNENLIHATPYGKERNHIYDDILKDGYGAVSKKICKYKYLTPYIKRKIPKKVKLLVKSILRRKHEN